MQPPGARPAVSEVSHPDEDEHGADEEHVHLPPSSVWPITTAFGLTLVGFGFVSHWLVSVLGGLMMFYAIVGWVQELRHEQH